MCEMLFSSECCCLSLNNTASSLRLPSLYVSLTLIWSPAGFRTRSSHDRTIRSQELRTWWGHAVGWGHGHAWLWAMQTHTDSHSVCVCVACTHWEMLTHTYCLHPLALLCCTDLACLDLLCLCVCILFWRREAPLLPAPHRPEEGCWSLSPGWLIVCSHKDHVVPEG